MGSVHAFGTRWKDTAQVVALAVGALWVVCDLFLGKSMPSADVEIKNVAVMKAADKTGDHALVTMDVQLTVHSASWAIRKAALSVAAAGEVGPLAYPPNAQDGCQEQLATLKTFASIPPGDVYRVSCLAAVPLDGCTRIQVRVEGARTFALMPQFLETRWWGSETRAQQIVCPTLPVLSGKPPR
jgi:predicted Zn-dependent protease